MAVVQTGSVLEFNVAATNTGTVSSTITVPADAELIVVGVATYEGGTVNFISAGSMTFTKGGSGTAMVAVQPSTRGDASTSFFMAGIFYQTLPDTGANKTLTFDWAGANNPGFAPKVSVTFWKGVDTASPVRGSGGGQNNATPFSTNSITALSGDKIVAFVAGYQGSGEGSVSAWSNLTLLAQLTANGNSDGAWATTDPSGNTTVGISTWTFDDGGIVGISLKPAAAAGATPYNPWPQLGPILGQ